MSNDCYTQGHTQWFYFSVKNVVVGQSVNFNIRNFSKPDSLFTEGETGEYSERRKTSFCLFFFVYPDLD